MRSYVILVAGVITTIGSSVSETQAAPQEMERRVGNKNGEFTVQRILNIPSPIRYGDWYWNEEGVPDGELTVTVDLQARVMSVWRGGYEIGATAVLLGTEDHPTPTGVFPILTKERHNTSSIYDDAPMPWTLRLTWDGIAIHGGSEIENGYASHGCVAAPDPFMDKLFATAGKGDKVIITDGRFIGLGESVR